MRSFAVRSAAVALAVAALVVVGRWERSRQIHGQVRGMEHVVALVGPLDNATLSGYRVQPGFSCLTYRRGSNVFALELCVDDSGESERRAPANRVARAKRSR